MRKTNSRALSFLLTLAMMFSLAVPALAADSDDAYVRVTLDGRETYTSSRVDAGSIEILASDVREAESATVNGETFTAEELARTVNDASWHLIDESKASMGRYKLYASGDTVRMDWLSLKTDLVVALSTRRHDDYTVTARAVPASACDVSVDAETSVPAGDSYVADFAPTSASQEIRDFTITVGGVTETVSAPVSGSKVATVNGVDVELTARSGGAVRVLVESVTRDVALVAEMYNATTRYSLGVIVDGYLTTSVEDEMVEEGGSRDVTLTPASGRSVGVIKISDGGKSGEIGVDGTSVKVNGKTYSVKRNLDGSVVLSVPAMTGDVLVSVSSTNEGHFIKVDVSGSVTCVKAGTNYVADGEPFAVTFKSRRDLAGMTIKVTTDRGTYKADMYDNYIVVGGNYYPIYRNVDGDVTINFTQVFGNMTVSAEGRDAEHEVRVKTDSRVTSDAASTVVLDDGEDFVITFTPDSDREIRSLRVTYDGVATTVDPKTATYIRVDGKRWDVTRDATTGVVKLYMEDVQRDCEVYATTVRTGSSGGSSSSDRTYRVNKTLDSHSNLSYTGSSPFYAGEDTTLHVYSDNKYIISSIRLSMNGKSVTVEPFDTSFKLDGETYEVEWDTNASCYIDIDGIYANWSVTVKSVSGTEKTYNGQGSGRYQITKSAGANSTISYSGKAPFYDNESVTIRAQANKNYVLSSVKFTMGNRSATIKPFDTSFTLNGRTYKVDWVSNRDVSVTFAGLTANVTVETRAERGTEKLYVTTTDPTNPWTPDPNFPGSGQISGTPSGYHAAYMTGYGNGYFGPDDMMTRAQAITILCRVYAGNIDYSRYAALAGYSDVQEGQWFAGFVGYAKQMGYLSGLYGGMTALEPNRAITRAEFLVLLCTFTNQNLVGVSVAPKYSDTANHWASAYINYCTERNWVSGYGNGLFGPDEALTRAQICVMVNRINNRMPGAAMSGYAMNFYDVTPNHWAFGDIMEAANAHTVRSVEGGREVWVY